MSLLSNLSPGLVAALCAIVAVQVALDVVALVDLYRRPKDRITFSNKWIWLAIVLLVNMLGAIAYLILGRRAAPAREPPEKTDREAKAAEAVDLLYGQRGGKGSE
jgi:hypothetical protein